MRKIPKGKIALENSLTFRAYRVNNIKFFHAGGSEFHPHENGKIVGKTLTFLCGESSAVNLIFFDY